MISVSNVSNWYFKGLKMKSFQNLFKNNLKKIKNDNSQAKLVFEKS